MTTLSFLNGCHDCLERGHKSWESYFSKWDLLAKNEEAITESGLIEELNENIDPKTIVKNKRTKRRTRTKTTKNISQKKKVNMTKTEPIQRREKKSTKLPQKSLANKLSLRRIKTTRCKKVKKQPKKKKKSREVTKPTKEPDLVETDEGLQDDSDNKQLEMDLRIVFLNILKGNKTKWEIFNVLSQTMSRHEVKIKTYHELEFSPKLAKSDDSGRCLSLTSQNTIHFNVPSLNDSMTILQPRRLDVKCNSFKRPNDSIEILDGYQVLNNLRRARGPGYLDSGNLNQTFPIDKVKAIEYNCVSPYRPLDPYYQTPKVNFNMANRFSKGIYNVENLIHSYLNNSQNESEKRLKLLPLDCSGASGGSEGSKININRLSFLKAPFSDVPQMNVRREKTFQNLCLHKRTSDVSLNMENSNFVTPKRNPSERKCFTENILQRKKRGRSKLSFFDYVTDDDSDSDDPSENRSPIIRWESKKPKIEIEEITIDDSDSDESEAIFDRVRKP